MRQVPIALTVFVLVTLAFSPTTGIACGCADEPLYRTYFFRIPAELRYYSYVNGHLKLGVLRDPEARLADAVKTSQGHESESVVVHTAASLLSAGTESTAKISDASDRLLREHEGKYRNLDDQTAAILDSMLIVSREESPIR